MRCGLSRRACLSDAENRSRACCISSLTLALTAAGLPAGTSGSAAAGASATPPHRAAHRIADSSRGSDMSGV